MSKNVFEIYCNVVPEEISYRLKCLCKNAIVMLCAIWYHLCNFKNMKNTHEGMFVFIFFSSIKFLKIFCKIKLDDCRTYWGVVTWALRIRSYSGLHFSWIFPQYGLNTDRCSVSLRIQFECGKIRTRITPTMDTFYAIELSRKYAHKGYVTFFPSYSNITLFFLTKSRENIRLNKTNQWKGFGKN